MIWKKKIERLLFWNWFDLLRINFYVFIIFISESELISKEKKKERKKKEQEKRMKERKEERKKESLKFPIGCFDNISVGCYMSVMVVSTTAMYHRRGYVGSPSMVDTGHKNNTVVSPGTYQVLGGSSATSTVGEIIDWSSSKSWILDFPTFALFRNILLKSITPNFHYWKLFEVHTAQEKVGFLLRINLYAIYTTLHEAIWAAFFVSEI